MLVECGFVRAATKDGDEYTFTPSFGRIAALGSPHEIVATYAGLHGPRAPQEAAYVLDCLCDQEDVSPLIGFREGAAWTAGMMPEADQIINAQHLMQHGIAGTARPGGGSGQYSDRFDAHEYVAAARVYLGLSSADAEALSMTEFQQMLEMKFPDQKAKDKDLPTREQYDAAMKQLDEVQRGA